MVSQSGRRLREMAGWQNSNTSWVSDGEKLAGVIAYASLCNRERNEGHPDGESPGLPRVQFGQGRNWDRRYTDFYGATGNNAWKIARDGLLNAAKWSDAVDAWQAPYVNDGSKPLWVSGHAF